ncbi:aminoglycoside phosphotransferase family protein [Pseudoponticoccus marisrubri]|uniref:Aminoglycoside phosphotransferase n=1 Tax=Pseudoponticoccus marisrubri TaxID=1685382 RepID=A0A0W7WG34_9RHOB|nr:phosphotransferase [Pseudoponticoccus marisrubri]KUF09526.1 aminoglycoside phosphotransferase [Pseudoponticoccus marisrubri]
MTDLLAQAGWDTARQEPLAGDASTRRYTRLHQGDRTAILMQDPGGDVALFARLADHLRRIGLSAPKILARDDAAGLLLLEDLGDGLVARLATDAATEKRLYVAATDVLVALHDAPLPEGLPLADADHLAALIDLPFRHYTHAPEALPEVAEAFRPLLAEHALPADVMVLRDYHAENILRLPGRTGPAGIGLLDFQDAWQGHRAYDLVSLIEDARRDVAPATAEACIRHYLSATGLPEGPFRTALAVQGAQRNLRILGVFARLAQSRGKPHYIDLIPRVWAHLQRDLAHPALGDLRRRVTDALPPPDPAHLQALKAPCPTP